MTASRPQGPRGPLISIEGISGVGKTYLTHRLVGGQDIMAIEPFSERAHTGAGSLGGQLLRALITQQPMASTFSAPDTQGPRCCCCSP